eukprot:3820708-Pyramimonas_sp.AAC.1
MGGISGNGRAPPSGNNGQAPVGGSNGAPQWGSSGAPQGGSNGAPRGGGPGGGGDPSRLPVSRVSRKEPAPPDPPEFFDPEPYPASEVEGGPQMVPVGHPAQ